MAESRFLHLYKFADAEPPAIFAFDPGTDEFGGDMKRAERVQIQFDATPGSGESCQLYRNRNTRYRCIVTTKSLDASQYESLGPVLTVFTSWADFQKDVLAHRNK